MSSKTFYAVLRTDHGPISVELEGDNAEEARLWAEAQEYGAADGAGDGLGRNWYDSGRTDLEDELGLELGRGESSSEASEALEAAGAKYLGDMGDRPDGWQMWVVKTSPYTYTYTIFDANSNSSSGTAWPTHMDIEIEADSDQEAIEEVESVMSTEAAGLNLSDGYEVGNLLHAIVWDEDDTIVGEPSYRLTAEDLGVGGVSDTLEKAIAALEDAGYDVMETVLGSYCISNAAPDSSEYGGSTEPGSPWDKACGELLDEINTIVRAHGCEADWDDNDIYITAGVET